MAGAAEGAAGRLREAGWNVTETGNLELPEVTATTVYFSDAPGERDVDHAVVSGDDQQRALRQPPRQLPDRRVDPPELSEAERELAETHVLDPHRPEAMAETFVRALRLIAPLRIAVAVTLVATGAGVAAWRWARASGQRRAVG